MPKMAKKKKPKRNFEDEEDAPTISTSNSKPVEIDDEDNSPVVSQSNEMKKKKHKKNPIDDPKKVPFPFSLDGSSLFHLNLSLNFFKLGFFFSFFFEEF